jgi:hypothetical protein
MAVCAHLIYFFPFGMLDLEKSGNPETYVRWNPSQSDPKESVYNNAGIFRLVT